MVVGTVDGSQGREFEVVIFSAVRAPEACATRSTLGFLSDERRLNVALTRAKSLLVVIGHGKTLRKSPAWAGLIDHAWNAGAYRHISASKHVDLYDLLKPRKPAVFREIYDPSW